MSMNKERARQYLQECNFKPLFIEELGWDHFHSTNTFTIDEKKFSINSIAEKRGVQVFLLHVDDDSSFPSYQTRRKIDKLVTKSAHEHLIIFVNRTNTHQVWQWVAREPGKPSAYREYHYYKGQSGEVIIQKLNKIAFTLNEEEGISLLGIVFRLRDAFDRDKVTKRFYDRFKDEQTAFIKFLKGIPDEDMKKWYVSVMIDRLMFIYFIQQKGFLNDDAHYLNTKLTESILRETDRYYQDFLCPLFFEGFAKKTEERSLKIQKLLGNIPYLNGGLFMKHEIEKAHEKTIEIPDRVFVKLFNFFDEYQWHLDERPISEGKEINPDVLGYIFEKYINQKQMGAYYTKEDITGYNSKNTIIPFLFDQAKKECHIAFEGEHSVWMLLKSDPDKYIYEAVRRGVIGNNGDIIPESSLPDFVQKGMHDPKARMFDKRYNLGEVQLFDGDGNKLTLPTETWREYVERRKRCLELRDKLARGEVHEINDLITYNLDIVQFAQDVIENCEGPELLRAFWSAIIIITVLDPTCGSGAFLFAALNILEILYEACLDRMQVFVDELQLHDSKHRPEKYSDFKTILAHIEQHANRKYFVFKSIIIHNLYGVDIMEEAVEICKLRLFLKLVAQVDDVNKIEPLPDIDFNIRAGNTLVGYATYDEVKHVVESKLDFGNAMKRIEEKMEDVDNLFQQFRKQQTELGGEATQKAKQELQERLRVLDDELNAHLASEYGIDQKKENKFKAWLFSYRPFHWFIEFHAIMMSGGFNVIIGNPPFVEYSKVRKNYSLLNYRTLACGNLYAFISERSLNMLSSNGSFSFIYPISMVCTQRMEILQNSLKESASLIAVSNYAERPSKLFSGAEVLLTIALIRKANNSLMTIFSTGFTKWTAEERINLFEMNHYSRVETTIKPYVLPKISSNIEEKIFRKIALTHGRLGNHFSVRSKSTVYYRIGGGRYWKIFTNFQPKFILNGKRNISSRENYLLFANDEYRDCTVAVLSSSLFYWYFILSTNCRDLNPVDLQEFPFNFDLALKDSVILLASLTKKLMDDYLQHSQLKEKTSSLTGEMVYQEFYPRESKHIIDKIDTVLAEHYGFTDEELDFIINYDIKYRMGRDAGEEE